MVVYLLSLLLYPHSHRHSLFTMGSKFWDPMRSKVGTKTEVVTREQSLVVISLTMLPVGEMWIWGF